MTSNFAQYASIGISSLIAISVVFLNKWITDNRSRKEQKIQKIEELYVLAINFEKKFDLFVSAETDINNYFSIYNEVAETLSRIEMIIALHFSKTDYPSSGIIKPINQIYFAYKNAAMYENEVDYDVVESEIDKYHHVDSYIELIKCQCIKESEIHAI